MSPYPDWYTLRELDQRTGCAKGAAFRAFKHIAAAHAEGRDYLVLQAPQHHAAIEALRAQGRIYLGSVKVVLLGERLAGRIVQALRAEAQQHR